MPIGNKKETLRAGDERYQIMSAKRRKKNRNAGAICIGLIVCAFLIVMAVQIVNLKQKDKAYAERQTELQEQYEKETERQTELDEYEAYTKSQKYIEDIAKSKLGLAYDNEIIFKESEE